MLNKQPPNFLIFSGYHATGISAVRDLLKGSNEINIFNNEFRLIRERYGLYELYNSIFYPYCPQASDLALKDFIWLTKKMAKSSSIISGQGLGFDNLTKNFFTKATKIFLDEIIKYEYPIDFHVFDFKKSSFKFFVKRLKKKILNNDLEFDNAFMTISEREEFKIAAKKYLISIFENSFVQTKNYIGLHNAISIQNEKVVKNCLSFFNNPKLIIADRDPRDIFFDFPYKRYLPDIDNKNLSRVDAFIDFYKILRINKNEISKLENVLMIKFEDLCLQTEKVTKEIENFLGLQEKIKIEKNFSPIKSRENIGIWREKYSSNKVEIDKIEKNLLL